MQLTEGHAGRHRRSGFDEAAAAVAVQAPPAPCSRCVQVLPNAALEVAELISIDNNSILMLSCMVRATFSFMMLQLRAHAAEAAVCLFCLRDGRDATTAAVAYPCCWYDEQWAQFNVVFFTVSSTNRTW